MTDESVTNRNALKPERSRTFLELVVSYPAICTYPEYEGKPYYAIQFEENGETIVGFGTYKPEVLSQYLQEYFIPSAESERTAKVLPCEIDQTTDGKHWGKVPEPRCGKCLRVLKTIDKYCPKCGARLEWE